MLLKHVGDIELNEYVFNEIKSVEYPLANRYSELCLTASIGGFKPFIYSRTLLYSNDIYQRIRIVKMNCSNCSWHGYIGDPHDSENYVGIPYGEDRKKAIERIKLFDKTPCPRCETHFDRPAIWVGELPELSEER